MFAIAARLLLADLHSDPSLSKFLLLQPREHRKMLAKLKAVSSQPTLFLVLQRPGRSYTQPCRRGGAAATSTGAALKSAASHTSEALMGRGGVGGGPARSCDAVIRDVRGRTARERVRMLDLFKDFDRLGHGK